MERNYTKAIVIVHGKSERYIVKHIKSKLRVPIEIYARENGQKSIQIQSLKEILTNTIFKSAKSFCKEFNKVELDNKGKPINIKIFMIMDVDDVTDKNIIPLYKNKAFFPKSWLKPLLVPIFNDLNLEDVFNKIGYSIEDKKQYKKIFPVERGKQDRDSIIELRDKLKQVASKSNLYEFVDFCLANHPVNR